MVDRRPLVVAIVGATGAVGRMMLTVLAERRFPATEVRLMASARSAGATITRGPRTHTVIEATPDAFDGVDIALFSAGSETSKALAVEAALRGCTVIDNSSAWRMDADVPLVVSQVNPGDLEWHRGIIANPNCSTMQVAPLLMALRDAVGLERVVIDTYQSVSGTGQKGIAELEAQLAARATGAGLVPAVYPHPIALNAIPHIDAFLPNGYTKEEWKLVAENRKILGLPDLRVSATAVRVPVVVGHSEAVHVETTGPVSAEGARFLFRGVPGVVVTDDPAANVYPLAMAVAGRDEIHVGRVRSDPSVPGGRGLAFWVVADNVRKGAATNAVEIAELLVDRDLLGQRI